MRWPIAANVQIMRSRRGAGLVVASKISLVITGLVNWSSL